MNAYIYLRNKDTTMLSQPGGMTQECALIVRKCMNGTSAYVTRTPTKFATKQSLPWPGGMTHVQYTFNIQPVKSSSVLRCVVMEKIMKMHSDGPYSFYIECLSPEATIPLESYLYYLKKHLSETFQGMFDTIINFTPVSCQTLIIYTHIM